MAPKKDAKKGDKGKGGEAELTPEEKLELEKKELEGEKENLGVELAFMKDKLHQTKNDVERMHKETAQLKARLDKATADAADILEHKQTEIHAKQMQVTELEDRVTELEAALAERDARIAELEALNEKSTKRLEDSVYLEKEKIKLEGLVKAQEAALQKSEESLTEKQESIDGLRAELEELQELNKDLTLASQGAMELKILFDDPWMVQSTKCRLKADVPVDRECNSLTCMGKSLIMYGGTGREFDKITDKKELKIVDLETYNWEGGAVASMGKNQTPITHHSAVMVRSPVSLTQGQGNGEVGGHRHTFA